MHNSNSHITARSALCDGRARALTRGLLAASVALVALTAGATSAHAQLEGPPAKGCPPMWKPAFPPLNPALKCVPAFIKSAFAPQRGPSGECAPMWRPALRPLNPQLGCVPSFVNSALRPQRGPTGGCPPMWKKVYPPWNPALKCLPDFFNSALGATEGPADPGTCPPMWEQARRPLNAALGCVPGFVNSALAPAQGPPKPGSCPAGWMRARPPLNPALGCVPGFVKQRAAPAARSDGRMPADVEAGVPAAEPGAEVRAGLHHQRSEHRQRLTPIACVGPARRGAGRPLRGRRARLRHARRACDTGAVSNLGAILTAIVTPFDDQGSVDEPAFVRLMHHLAANGSDGFVVCGTTGEAATLDDDEHLGLIELAVNERPAGSTIVAGVGSNDTRHAVHLTARACELGADALLSVNPYYNRPNRRGIIAHYREVVAAADRPIVLYNIPSRTGTDLPNEFLAELAQLDHIEYVKQANNDNLAPIDGLSIYSGNDEILGRVLDMGGAGGILVASHIVGPEMRRMVAEPGERAALHESLLPVFEALSVAPLATSVKAALRLLGHEVGDPRLPYVATDERETATIRSMLESRGLLAGAAA